MKVEAVKCKVIQLLGGRSNIFNENRCLTFNEDAAKFSDQSNGDVIFQMQHNFLAQEYDTTRLGDKVKMF